MKYGKIVISILIFTAFISCKILQNKEEDIDILIPSETEMPGWNIDYISKIYDSNSSAEYFNDNKKFDLYKLYGLEKIIYSDIVSISKPDKRIRMEICKMNSELNAYGILSLETDNGITKLNICNDSFFYNRMILARKSDFFIKLIPSGKPEVTKNELSLIAGIICSKIINPENKPVFENRLFDKTDEKLPQYLKSGNNIIPGIKNMFKGIINYNGKNNDSFYAHRDSVYTAGREFSQLLKDKNRNFVLTNTEKSGMAFSKTESGGFLFISVYKEWIFGVINAESINDGQKITNIMLNRLQDL